MRREPGGRLVAEEQDFRALLIERERQLRELENEVAALDEADHPKHERMLATARWSVGVLRERLREETRQ